MPRETFLLPRILDCSRHYLKSPVNSYEIGQRNVQHYELDYNISGPRVMIVNGKEYNVSEGCITCHIPAQIVASAGYYNMYMMTLEYTPLGDTIHRNCRLDNLVEPPCGSYIWDIIPPCFHPAHHEDIFAMYRRLSLLSKQPERSEEAASLLCQILHQVTADAYAESCHEKTSNVLDILLDYLYDHFDRHISLNEMAALVHLNKSYLIRLFRRETGQTPLDFLNGIRLSHARRLLLSTNLKVSEIAFRCGFESASYFIRRFHAAYNLTPEQYRVMNGAGTNKPTSDSAEAQTLRGE